MTVLQPPKIQRPDDWADQTADKVYWDPSARQRAIDGWWVIHTAATDALGRLAAGKRPPAYVVEALMKIQHSGALVGAALNDWDAVRGRPQPPRSRLSLEAGLSIMLAVFIAAYMAVAASGAFRTTVVDLDTPCWAYNETMTQHGMALLECTDTGQFTIGRDLRATIDELRSLQGAEP